MANMRHIVECKCECLDCFTTFHYNSSDLLYNEILKRDYKANMFLSSILYLQSIGKDNTLARIESNQHEQLANDSLSLTRDFNRCPDCGSSKLSKEFREYDVDEFGSYIAGSESQLQAICVERVENCVDVDIKKDNQNRITADSSKSWIKNLRTQRHSSWSNFFLYYLIYWVCPIVAVYEFMKSVRDFLEIVG